MPDKAPIAALLLDWFDANKRDLPWRRDYDPYKVWLSEIMAQQTQMDRVVPYFNRFLSLVPNVAALAEASENDVLKAWEGLGYYRRARNMQAAARQVMADHGGRFPESMEAIRALPGIGDYTAGAVASIAFGRPVVAVDANVSRVLARICDIDVPVREAAGKARVGKQAQDLLPEGHSREFNQALMEFGALVCRPKNPDCPSCPVRDHCAAFHLDIVPDRPVLSQTRDITPLLVATGVLVQAGRIFIQKRLPTGAWGNLWEFPGGRIETGESAEEAIVREYVEETAFETGVTRKLGIIRHGYTTYRVTLHCFLLHLTNGHGRDVLPHPILTAAQESRWVKPDELSRFAFPAGHRKLIDDVLQTMAFA